MVGREPAEPMTPAEPTSSARENTFSLVRRSTETGSSVIYGRCSSRLSAILLNDDYYRFLIEGRNMSGDITVLDALHIIPLKMRAWIDLTMQKHEGLHVNERDIRKHRQDVFRLFPLVNADARVGVSPLIYDDIQYFISKMRSSEFDLKAIHILTEKDAILEIYDSIYYKKTDE